MGKYKSQQLRIIAGQYRGRKISLPSSGDIRPTGDRMRETLFNWLTPYIAQAHCLDLFAGSGALGLEALSRGAASVVFVDEQPAVMEHLQSTANAWQINNATFYQARVPEHLPSISQTFDLVFLDPPFRKNLIANSCRWLENNGLLHPNAFIYVETEKEFDVSVIPCHWHVYRHKLAGEVRYTLYQRG